MLLKLKACGVTSVWFKRKQDTPSAETRNIRGQARHGDKRARLDGRTRLTFDVKQKEGVKEDGIVFPRPVVAGWGEEDTRPFISAFRSPRRLGLIASDGDWRNGKPMAHSHVSESPILCPLPTMHFFSFPYHNKGQGWS